MSGEQHDAPTSGECEHMLERVYEFLDHELDTASSDEIREHLAACEPCLDRFDLEAAVKSLVGRCCGGDKAPEHLRAKVLYRLAEVRTETTVVRTTTTVTTVELD